jgi:hypothetical protein
VLSLHLRRAPFIERVRNVQWLRSALAGVSAAVVGVIASLRCGSALHVLFAEVGQASAVLALARVRDLGASTRRRGHRRGRGVALLRIPRQLFAVLGADGAGRMAVRLLLKRQRWARRDELRHGERPAVQQSSSKWLNATALAFGRQRQAEAGRLIEAPKVRLGA